MPCERYCEKCLQLWWIQELYSYLRRLDGRIRGKWMEDDAAFLLGLKILVEFNFSLLLGKAILSTRSNLHKDREAVKSEHIWKLLGENSQPNILESVVPKHIVEWGIAIVRKS